MNSLKPLAIGLAILALLMAAGPPPAAAASDSQIAACRNRVLQNHPSVDPGNVSINQAWESNGSVRLDWSAGAAGTGLCVIGPRDEVFQFIDDRNSQWAPGNQSAPSGNQSFGDVPGVGQFVVVNNSGHQNNGVVDFQAYVNGRGPTSWTAECNTGRLREGNRPVPDSGGARYVVSYICSGGPPQQVQSGTVNFGNVPGIGQFAVVNGSGNSHNGIVDFDAYANGYGPTRWTAQCGNGRLQQSGNELPYSSQSQYVVSYICGGGAPQQTSAGTVDFGDLPGVGHFVVANNSGNRRNGFVTFQAWVNGNGPAQWVADCSRDNVQRGGNYATPSARARYVASYICSGGPPRQFESGTVNFGFVSGVGQLAVVNSSGSANNGIVQFQAYVNGAGPSTWTADCGTGRLGQNGNYAQYRDRSQYVVSYICNGGPPGGGWGR